MNVESTGILNRMRIDNKEIVTDDISQVVIDNFPDIVHSVDGDGNIVFTNNKAEELLGYPREELLTMNVRDIYADDMLEALDKGFKELKKTGESAVESALKDRFGNRIPVEIRSFGIYDQEGNFIRTFSILRDIRPIKELQEGLIHTERLAAIGELASGIVHDINNPLSVIKLCCTMLHSTATKVPDGKGVPVEETKEMCGDIDRASVAIEKLVTHLRNFARKDAENPAPYDLYDSVTDALFLLRSKITKNRVLVKNHLEPESCYAHGSSNQIEQVFANIISNACDAMNEREERLLTIRTSSATREGVELWKTEIIDTGQGIPREIREEIFAPFFTTKKKGKGTGLGLSISRGIALDQGGDIDVFSHPGKGTIFTVYLPKASGA